MKRACFVFLLCLALVLGTAAAIALPVCQSREEVAVTAETRAGDPAQAAGLTARQGMEYQRRLLWDVTIPADRPEESRTTYTYVSDPADLPQREPTYWGIELYSPRSSSVGFSGGSEGLKEILEFDRSFLGVDAILEDVASRAPETGRYAEVIDPADYRDTYPLSMETDLPNVDSWRYSPHGWAGSEEVEAYDRIIQTLEGFFSFPIPPEDNAWEVVIEKNEAGDFVGLELHPQTGGFVMNTVSAVGTETCFFAFAQNYGEASLDFSQVPGGSGVYAIDYPLGEGFSLLDMDSLRNFCPLPEGTDLIDLALSEDETTLVVVTYRGGTYTCTVLDAASAAVCQSFSIPASPPEPVYTIYYDEEGEPMEEETSYSWGISGLLWEKDCLLIYGNDTMSLYLQKGQGFTHAMTAEPPEALRYNAQNMAMAWNGEKLALAVPSYESAYDLSFTLSVFREGELVYEGVYENSLNAITDVREEETYDNNTYMFYSYILPFDANRLSIRWQ